MYRFVTAGFICVFAAGTASAAGVVTKAFSCFPKNCDAAAHIEAPDAAARLEAGLRNVGRKAPARAGRVSGGILKAGT